MCSVVHKACVSIVCQDWGETGALAVMTMTLKHAEQQCIAVCVCQQARHAGPVSYVASRANARKVSPSTAHCLLLCLVTQQAASLASQCSVW